MELLQRNVSLLRQRLGVNGVNGIECETKSNIGTEHLEGENRIQVTASHVKHKESHRNGAQPESPQIENREYIEYISLEGQSDCNINRNQICSQDISDSNKLRISHSAENKHSDNEHPHDACELKVTELDWEAAEDTQLIQLAAETQVILAAGTLNFLLIHLYICIFVLFN